MENLVHFKSVDTKSALKNLFKAIGGVRFLLLFFFGWRKITTIDAGVCTYTINKQTT